MARPGDAMLPDERRRLIAQSLREHGSVSVAALESELGISPMTARRDLGELVRRGVARRTRGGAVLPDLSRHEDSFVQRLEAAPAAKARLAEVAVGLLAPGEGIFLDSSTTAFYAARVIVRNNLRCTLLTNAVAILELATEIDASQVEVIGIGGTLRKLTRSFVGPAATAGVYGHFADHALLSVRGLTDDGYLTDPDPLEAEVKRAMIERAHEPVLLVDGSKLGRPALAQLGHLDAIARVLVADPDPQRLAALRANHEAVRVV
jgi:DeoR/GlpR family transcriptional regulator of sugar metabolism